MASHQRLNLLDEEDTQEPDLEEGPPLDRTLLELYGSICYALGYPTFVVFFIILVDVGFASWPLFVLLLTPPTIVWYIILRRRAMNFFRLLMSSHPTEWDVKTAVEEYVAMMKKRRQNSRDEEI